MEGVGDLGYSFQGLLMGICEVGRVRNHINVQRNKQCNGAGRPSSLYIINEVNVGAASPVDSIFNVMTHVDSGPEEALNITLTKAAAVASFTYRKKEDDTFIQVIMASTVTETENCMYLYLTFNGGECTVPIGSTVWHRNSNMEYHKPVGLFGLCRYQLNAGPIIIELNIIGCGDNETATTVVNFGSQIQFEASEINLGFFPPSISNEEYVPAVPLFNFQHFEITIWELLGSITITYKKLMKTTKIYMMFGISIKGIYFRNTYEWFICNHITIL